VDVGIVGGDGVLNEKAFQGFRIMGKIMNQGFNQKAVLNLDLFIFAHRNFIILVSEDVVGLFEFITPDIAFVEQGVGHPALAQKITSGQIGVPKLEIEGVVGGNAVKSIEFNHLPIGNQILDIGIDIRLILALCMIRSNNFSSSFIVHPFSIYVICAFGRICRVPGHLR